MGGLDYGYWAYETGRKRYNKLIRHQTFVRERFTALGPDLAAAQFLCWRNCRVRFKGLDRWMEVVGGRLPLPDSYEPGWYVEAIDAAQSELIYEGLQNIRNLVYLKYIDLSYCPHIDVWCIDRIAGEYGDSLEFLDISGCPMIQSNAIAALARFRQLKKLILYDLDHVKDLKLLCVMLLDLNPQLEIHGVDYIDTKLLEGTEHQKLLDDLDEIGGYIAPKSEDTKEIK